MARPLILSYNLSPRAEASLRALCDRQGIRFRAVSSSEYALAIGALAGIPTARAAAIASAEDFSDEMLVMCHMMSDQLDAFLLGMRQCGIPKISLKAILTPSNVCWNSRQLRDELVREHEAMQSR